MSQINVNIVNPESGTDVTVNGNLIVTGTTNIRPYKVYSALLTQTGTTAPTEVVLENTIGSIFLSRVGVGIYHISSNNLFTADKTCISCNNIGYTNNETVYAAVGGLNFCQLFTKTNVGVSSDDILFKNFVEIRVYD